MAVEALQDNQKAALRRSGAKPATRALELARSREAQRQRGSLQVRYYDTLPGQASKKEARAVLKVVLQAASQKHQPLPAPVSELRQMPACS